MAKARFLTLLAGIFALGIIIRTYHLLLIQPKLGFGLGGLYMEFAAQIANHGFRLPDTIPFYTQGGIPYAYPPLPFYVEAALYKMLPINQFLLANLLPPAIAISSLFAFYALVRQMRLTPIDLLIALLAYATLRTAYAEQIEAQGLAEASGSLLLIGVAYGFSRLKEQGSAARAAVLGIMLGLGVLASPGSAYAVIPTFAIFALGQIRQTRLRYFMLAAGVGLLLTLPFFAAVIQQHGIGVFLDPFVNEHKPAGSPLEYLRATMSLIMKFDATSPYNFVANALVFVGSLWLLAHRRWELPAWFLLMMVLPREGAWLSALPAALIIGLTARELITPLLRAAEPHFEGHELIPVIMGVFIVGVFMLGDLMEYAATHYHWEKATYEMTQSQYDAMAWMRDHTPSTANLIVLVPSWTAVEWTPHIARRTVLNSEFGAEWQPDELRRINDLKAGLSGAISLDNMTDDLADFGYQAQDIYLLIEQDDYTELTGPDRINNSTAEVLYENHEVMVVHVTWNG